MFRQEENKGFSIFTLIVGIGIMAVLAVGAFVLLNPTKRLGQSYNARRWTDVQAIAKAIEFYNLENQGIPSDFSTTTLSTSDKFVLCDSEGALECGGETLGCLVVDDADFLGKYIDTLPVDPLKSDASDTGYYVSRSGDNMLVVGACDTYDNESISMIARASLPDYVVLAVCGNGATEGDEVCDDGVNEECGDGIVQNGSYCNSTCDGYNSLSEVCDYTGGPSCFNSFDSKTYYEGGFIKGTCGKNDIMCAEDCSACTVQCLNF